LIFSAQLKMNTSMHPTFSLKHKSHAILYFLGQQNFNNLLPCFVEVYCRNTGLGKILFKEVA